MASRISVQARQIHRSAGFTLIEMIVTFIVLAILVAIAIPGFSQFIVSTRLTSQINELVGDVSRARNEAGTRGTSVSICIAASPTACATSGTDWKAGRIIFADRDGNGVIASATDVIKYVPPLEGNVSLEASGFTNTWFLTFRPFGGLVSLAGGTFTLCAADYTKGRKLVVAGTGRPSATTIPNATDTTTCP